jgi:hypothetical protein
LVRVIWAVGAKRYSSIGARLLGAGLSQENVDTAVTEQTELLLVLAAAVAKLVPLIAWPGTSHAELRPAALEVHVRWISASIEEDYILS